MNSDFIKISDPPAGIAISISHFGAFCQVGESIKMFCHYSDIYLVQLDWYPTPWNVRLW